MPRSTKNSQSVSHDELSKDSKYIVELMNDKFDGMSEELSNLRQLLMSEKEARSKLEVKVIELEKKVVQLP